MAGRYGIARASRHGTDIAGRHGIAGASWHGRDIAGRHGIARASWHGTDIAGRHGVARTGGLGMARAGLGTFAVLKLGEPVVHLKHAGVLWPDLDLHVEPSVAVEPG